MLNTQLVPGDEINVKLSAFRAGRMPADGGVAYDDEAHHPRAVVLTRRPVAAGEERFLD